MTAKTKLESDTLHTLAVLVSDLALGALGAYGLGDPAAAQRLARMLPSALPPLVEMSSDQRPRLVLEPSLFQEAADLIIETLGSRVPWLVGCSPYVDWRCCLPQLTTAGFPAAAVEDFAARSEHHRLELQADSISLSRGLEVCAQWLVEIHALEEIRYQISEAFVTAASTPLSSASSTGSDSFLAELGVVHEKLDRLLDRQTTKEWYSTQQAAKYLHKSEYTVREWCRHGQCRAEKRKAGRGGKKQWTISHEELLRLESEGPWPRQAQR